MALHDKCVLMDLTLRLPATSRTDPGITADVIKNTSATDDSGRWVTKLWPKEALAPITKHDSATARYHKDMTLPWLDNSKRILPSARFLDYMDTMRLRKGERANLVTAFLDRLDHWIQEAAVMRGTSFDPSDYGDRYATDARFDFKTESEPVPHRDDFRVNLAGPDIEEMQATLEERLAVGARIVRNDIIRRITAPLLHMVERLSEPGASFRDSLFTNVRDIAAIIPDLNVSDDPEIDAIRLQIEATINGLDPATVRDSASHRTRTARAATDILSTMAPWLEEAADDLAA